MRSDGLAFYIHPPNYKSHSWEQRKLGELCNITTGKLDANAMVSDGQYDFYTSFNLDSDIVFILSPKIS